MITMTTTPKPLTDHAEQQRKQPEDIQQALKKYLSEAEPAKYKIIYDVPDENMQPLFNILAASGYKLHSVAPAIVSPIGSFYPTQFIFELARVIAWWPFWVPILIGLLCLITLLMCVTPR